jgi:ADP-heptose:LPS heptosyltransferase
LFLTPSEIVRANEILAGLPRPRVVVHPGNVHARNWASEHYFELVMALRRDGFSVILTGSEREWENFSSPDRNADLANKGVVNLMKRLNLRELLAVIHQCDLVVSGATGPMHAATALNVSTVSLFDPQRGSSMVRWGPLGDRGIVFKPEVPTCEKCVYEKCPYWDCMDRIQVGTIAQKVREVLLRK